MTSLRTLKFRWTGESMVPLMLGVARNEYDEGEVYPLEVREDRSTNSHNHYFAAIHEGWLNLPEAYAGRFPTSEHLRKYLLIRTGYRDESSIVVSSKAQALGLAKWLRDNMDDFTVIEAIEATVSVYKAKSQSKKAMGARVFQESKQAVLDELAAMIGTSAQQLQANAGKAA